MSNYRRLYRRADVLDRWANIYGGERLAADFARLHAAEARFQAEMIKVLHLEEIAAWLVHRLPRA